MKKMVRQKRVKASQDKSPQAASKQAVVKKKAATKRPKVQNKTSLSKPAGKNRPTGAAKAAPDRKRATGKKKPGIKKRVPRSRLSAADIEEIFARFAADTPEPKGELEHTNPYTLLVAVALSAQATDVGVNKATRALFKVADTPHKMLALGEDALREYIKTIGLYRNKAKNVIAMSKMLVEEFDSKIPADRAALERLPGVGRKTANVVLNMAFGMATIAVDTHLFRVANRSGLAPGKDPLTVELGLLKAIPEHYLLHAHHWLILHGRYTCVARKPKCQGCIIRDLCKFKDKAQSA